MKKCYKYERRVTGVPDAWKVAIGKKVIIKDLLNFTDYGHLKWRVPKTILKTRSSSLKIAFLRGYYDGDGVRPDLNKNKNLIIRVRFRSTNIVGLKQIIKLLRDLNIKANLHFSSKRKKEYELSLYGSSARKFVRLTKSFKCRERR
ncbi:MAG: LAGLIDADG family homing endonuclease [Candidatus Aenigmatarchaeota archaeon]